MQNYIPWAISFGMLCLAFLTYTRNGSKDEHEKMDSIKESLLKANMKLDAVCATTSETRTDIKSTANKIQEIEKEMAIMKRDQKTAFDMIEELKGKVED